MSNQNQQKVRFWNVPNTLTVLRMVAIPVFVGVFYLPYSWSYFWAAVLFALAGITDWLDGYMARRLNQSTRLGAFLDPVADKLMVVIALVLLVEVYASALLAIPALTIIAREVAVSALREWMAEIGKRANVKVSKIGKIKTTVQIIAITGLLAKEPSMTDPIVVAAFLALYLAMGLTLWSMMIYLKAAWPHLTSDIE